MSRIKEIRYGCVKYSLYSQVIRFCESIMWFGGKNKCHTSIDLQEVGFGWPKPHYNVHTDGWSNSEKAYTDTPQCASKSGVIHFQADFVIHDCEVDWSADYSWEAIPIYG